MAYQAMFDQQIATLPDSPVLKHPAMDNMYNQVLHLDDVYVALVACTLNMENRVKDSLENYMQNPDVQANLQQLQYDLQSWNLALTTCTNMQKNMADALKSIVGNLR